MRHQLENILRDTIVSNLHIIFDQILNLRLYAENDCNYQNDGIIHDFLSEGKFDWKNRRSISILLGHEKPFMNKISPYMVKKFRSSMQADDITTGAWDSFTSYLFDYASQSLNEELLLFKLIEKNNFSRKIYALDHDQSRSFRQIFIVRDPHNADKVIGRFLVYIIIRKILPA